MPCSFSEIGKKENQEDRVYPAPENVKVGQKFFILCDGMGGHDCGEVASETVSKALGEYFDQHPVERADGDYFNEALAYAYACLDAKDTGSEKKMGTTMTCLYFNPDGFLAAHIGDSRIYQFRDGRIIFQTQDHSLFTDLLKAGEITEAEAKNYPRKNVITRAMQPNTRRSKADIFVSEDIQPGDYFFMCCDGVLERANTEFLCHVFAEKSSPSAKIAAIKAECDKGTKDNYTCWLIPVVGPFKQTRVNKTVTIEAHDLKREDTHSQNLPLNNRSTWWLTLLLTVLGIIVGFLLGRRYYNEPSMAEQDQEQITVQAPEEAASQEPALQEPIHHEMIVPGEVSDGQVSFPDEYSILQYEKDSLIHLTDSLFGVIDRMKEIIRN